MTVTLVLINAVLLAAMTRRDGRLNALRVLAGTGCGSLAILVVAQIFGHNWPSLLLAFGAYFATAIASERVFFPEDVSEVRGVASRLLDRSRLRQKATNAP